MHLELDILKGKFGKSKALKREAVSELKELGAKGKARALESMKGKVGSGKSHYSGKTYKH